MCIRIVVPILTIITILAAVQQEQSIGFASCLLECRNETMQSDDILLSPKSVAYTLIHQVLTIINSRYVCVLGKQKSGSNCVFQKSNKIFESPIRPSCPEFHIRTQFYIFI